MKTVEEQLENIGDSITIKEFQRFLVNIFRAIFLGGSWALCIDVLEKVVSRFSSVQPDLNYSLVANLLLDNRCRQFLFAAGDRYLALLEHCQEQGARVDTEIMKSLVKGGKGSIPFLQIAASSPNLFEALSRCLAKMVSEDDLSADVWLLFPKMPVTEFLRSKQLLLQSLGVNTQVHDTPSGRATGTHLSADIAL